jgi:hypothetical protein
MSDYLELELAIDDLDSEPAEEVLRNALKDLPGIHGARLLRGGVHIIYNPLGISPEAIMDEVRRAGFTVNYLQRADMGARQ